MAADGGVFVEPFGEPQLGSIRWKILHVFLDDAADGEATRDNADIFLQAADHDSVEVALADRNPAHETLVVEEFEEGAEAVGMAVVRRR